MKLSLIAALSFAFVMLFAPLAYAESSQDLDQDAKQALEKLYRLNPTAQILSEKAKAILIFPEIIKAGLIFGGSYGEGELLVDGRVDSYYNSVSGSWGLQAGAQAYSYAVFLMNDKALSYLRKSQGWEIGVGPTVVIVNEGVAKNLSSTTLKDDAYAFIFGQSGLMAGISLEGSKVNRIKR